MNRNLETNCYSIRGIKQFGMCCYWKTVKNCIILPLYSLHIDYDYQPFEAELTNCVKGGVNVTF